MYNSVQLSNLENLFDKEKFEEFYHDCKEKGMLEIEIADVLKTDCNTLRTLRSILGVKTVVIRRNRSGVTEEDIRKGIENGLNRRLILRRVRDGMSVQQAITTPKNTKKVTHRRKRK